MLQRKQPAAKNPVQNLAENSAALELRATELMTKLTAARSKLEAEARAAMARKDTPRAKQCFEQMKVQDARISMVREQLTHAQSAVIKTEVDDFIIQSAKMLQAAALSQSDTARKVDPVRVEALSASLAASAAQIQHTSTTVNTALKGITGRESDAAENAELERMAEGGVSLDAEFNTWAAGLTNAPISESPGRPAEVKEELEYVKFLKEVKKRENERENGREKEKQ